MGEKERFVESPGKFRQFLVAVTVNLSALSYGTMVGWQSPVIPQLQSENPPVGNAPMTDEAASWLNGVMCLSGTFVTLFIGVIIERFGRKVIGCSIAVPFCINWLLTIFAGSQAHLFIARFFAGVGGAIVLFLVPLYVSEISCDEIRGMLGSLLVFALNTGILLAYTLGAFFSFHVFAIVALILPLLYLAAFIFMPESPVYLIRQNRLHEAARSLMWLRAAHQPTVEREILRIQDEVKETACEKSVKLSDLFRDRATIKGLIITLGLFTGQQFCGIFAMISYTQTVFRISGSSLSPNASAITIGVIQVFGSYLSTSLMERMGRRPLISLSCLGMCICHIVLGTFCHLQNREYDVAAFGWIPVVALSLFVITYCLGMGPGPYVVTSEIFSRDITSIATTVGLVCVWLTAFLVVKLFPMMLALLGMDGCFFLFAFFCAVSFVFTLLLIPETKGRPRQDIVNELNGAPRGLNENLYAPPKNSNGHNLSFSEQL